MTGSKKKLRAADKLIPITVVSDKPAAPAESGADSQPASSAFAKATADKPPSAETTKRP
jgi:hypothetical protein